MINRALFGCSKPVFPKAKPDGQGGTDVWAHKKAAQQAAAATLDQPGFERYQQPKP